MELPRHLHKSYVFIKFLNLQSLRGIPVSGLRITFSPHKSFVRHEWSLWLFLGGALILPLVNYLPTMTSVVDSRRRPMRLGFTSHLFFSSPFLPDVKIAERTIQGLSFRVRLPGFKSSQFRCLLPVQ